MPRVTKTYERYCNQIVEYFCFFLPLHFHIASFPTSLIDGFNDVNQKFGRFASKVGYIMPMVTFGKWNREVFQEVEVEFFST